MWERIQGNTDITGQNKVESREYKWISTHFIFLVCLLKGFLGHKSQMNIRSFLEVDALKAIKVAQVCSARNHSVIVSKSCASQQRHTQRERERERAIAHTKEGSRAEHR